MSSLTLSSDDEDEEEEEGGGLEILMEAPEGFRNSDEDRFSESQVNRVQVIQCNCTDGNHHTYIDIVLLRQMSWIFTGFIYLGTVISLVPPPYTCSSIIVLCVT